MKRFYAAPCACWWKLKKAILPLHEKRPTIL